MPFYDALHYILSTATGKVKRKIWKDNKYICRKIIDNKIYIILHESDENSIEFNPNSEILTSTDWIVI